MDVSLVVMTAATGAALSTTIGALIERHNFRELYRAQKRRADFEADLAGSAYRNGVDNGWKEATDYWHQQTVIGLEAVPVPKTYIMCGGCGASVEVGEDGFTPKYHHCFTGNADVDIADTDMFNAATEAGYIDTSVYVEKTQEKDRKIPIGLSGHLHIAKKPVV